MLAISLGVNPEFIITDGLPSYRDSIIKEFHSWRKPQVNHVRLETIRAKINNNLVERYHSTFRERDKVMRGFKSENSARIMTEGFRTYYNFIREHMTLEKTPSEEAGIDLQLDRNKWLSLIRKSSKTEFA
ncbi:MAG: DDE-type integrase/transposase/recombinase [Candidatus Aenigmarchaeota archaeon]|nr:DDE-type integrase/transposase/recombinase [Candidatus Aenigmarchaeota archaeon]